MYIGTYFSYRITADDILVGSSAKMTQGDTLPATKEKYLSFLLLIFF